MTYQKSIEKLNKEMRKNMALNKALDVAISALNKQIPTEPIKKPSTLRNANKLCCPSCGHHLVLEVNADLLPNYCDRCGQCIKCDSKEEDLCNTIPRG